jgi:hypothetical protein
MPSLNPSIRRLRTPALAGAAAIVVCSTPLASAASAGAATRPAATAAASSLITFNVNQPAGTEMHVDFTGGLGSIAEQEIIGSSLVGDTTTPSSFSINAQGANSATDFVRADTTAGTPITGNAVLPAGTTVTASVNGGPSVAITNGSFSIPVASGLGGAPSAIPSIHVAPHAAGAGSKVKIYGIAPAGSKAGAKLTLMSKAFSGQHEVSGIPAVTTRVRAGGRYSATVRIAAKTKPSTYGVTGKVGNRYLQVASLTVRG